ncbi:uncharacterized protein DS421_2g47240 [Arachis hypogaea]|nr:uncharacterized protein DS421_2g47240 [Arachis hypogaea]
MSDSADLDSYISTHAVLHCVIYIRSICIDIIIYIQKAICFGRSLYSLGRGFD